MGGKDKLNVVISGNILVTSGRSIGIKLSDFDLSKILDPDASTSGMSSNVGTPAFKAPEYFQFFEQNRQRKIRYHRNVDVYALGLTYLALLQAVQGQNLRPQIETAQEDAELWVPSIGQLISERIKYKIDELRIVVVEGKEMTSKIKSIIQKMTAIDPKQRLRAAKLVDALHNVERRSRLSEAKETEKKLRKMIPYQNNHKLDGKKKLELMEKAKMAEQKLHEKRPSRKQLTVRLQSVRNGTFLNGLSCPLTLQEEHSLLTDPLIVFNGCLGEHIVLSCFGQKSLLKLKKKIHR